MRIGNIIAAKAVADAIRTSLGPRGMDKMIQSGNGEVVITNDGATILGQMQVFHPTAKMLVELSKSQDIEAGDGTTSVCVVAGALLNACSDLLAKGIHPMAVAESFLAAAAKAEEVLEGMSTPVDLANRCGCRRRARCLDVYLQYKRTQRYCLVPVVECCHTSWFKFALFRERAYFVIMPVATSVGPLLIVFACSVLRSLWRKCGEAAST